MFKNNKSKEIESKALHDRNALNYLFQSHELQWLRVIKKILDEYYERQRRLF